MSVGILSTDKTRFCERCLTTRPVDDFRLIWKGKPDRHAQCNVCHRAEQRERARRRRAKQDHILIAKSTTKLKNASTREQVEFIIASMIAAAGGVECLIQRWMEQVATASSNRKADFYAAMMRSVELCQPPEEDLDGVTNEDLSRLLDEHLLAIISDQPEAIAEVLRARGWTVTAPTDA